MSNVCHSRTALPVTLERYEIEALIEWHMEQRFRAADREEYADAQNHLNHEKELREILKTPLPEPQ